MNNNNNNNKCRGVEHIDSTTWFVINNNGFVPIPSYSTPFESLVDGFVYVADGMVDITSEVVDLTRRVFRIWWRNNKQSIQQLLSRR